MTLFSETYVYASIFSNDKNLSITRYTLTRANQPGNVKHGGSFI